jgi:hypothetical protein
MNTLRTPIRVKVLPRASRNEVVGLEDGVFKVKLTAPPLEGKANKALRALLAKKLGLSKSRIAISSGERSRLKTLSIDGLSPRQIQERLAP